MEIRGRNVDKSGEKIKLMWINKIEICLLANIITI